MLDRADIQRAAGVETRLLFVSQKNHEVLSQWLVTAGGAHGLADTEDFADVFGGNRRVGRR